MNRALFAEALGTALLLAVVVGSGIMGAQQFPEQGGLALLANAWATGLGLAVLIFVFGPVSGAHFNPVVTLAFCLRGTLRWKQAPGYILAQCAGAVIGVFLAHAMFDMDLLSLSQHARSGSGQWISETVASFGLVLTILVGVRQHAASVPWLVGAYIAAAYWFTASTSFANPAVTLARALTDSFAGIALDDVPAFVVMQVIGTLMACVVCRYLYRPHQEATRSNA